MALCPDRLAWFCSKRLNRLRVRYVTKVLCGFFLEAVGGGVMSGQDEKRKRR